MLQDMADAASRAAAMDTLERLLAQPHLWAQQQPSLNPGQDGDAAASFGGGSWAAAVSELAAKARECHDACVVADLHTQMHLNHHPAKLRIYGVRAPCAAAVTSCLASTALHRQRTRVQLQFTAHETEPSLLNDSV